jgi:hypothetical protein
MLHDPAFSKDAHLDSPWIGEIHPRFQKKSFLCLKDYQVARDIQTQAPETLAVSLTNRESDIYELKFQSQKIQQHIDKY